MSNNGKVIDCRTVSPLESLDHDVNEVKVRLKYLNNKIKGSIGDYRNALIEKNIQTPDMGEDDLISQLAFSLDIEGDKIDDINEYFYSDGKSPDYDEAPSKDMEYEAFDKFLGVYVELPDNDKA